MIHMVAVGARRIRHSTPLLLTSSSEMSAVSIETGHSTVRNEDIEKETDGAQKPHFQSTDPTLKCQDDGVGSHKEHVSPITRINSD